MKEKILNFFKKLVYNKKQDKLSIYKMLIIFMLVVVSISVGYSSLSSTLNITGIVSEIRLKSDIRITGLSASSSAYSGKSNYAEYNKDSIRVGVSLPSTDSTVTYKVKVTNIGNVEMGIKSISGLRYGFAYDIKDYTIGEKICDESNVCKLGISKEFYITIRYAYDYQEYLSTNTDYISSSTYNFDLEFDFRPAYTVTYTGIEGNYQTTILEGNTLRVNFGSNAPENIKVLMNNTKISDYTYSDGVLEIENVSGNIEIQKIEETLAQYIINLYNNSTTKTNSLEVNGITYSLDTTNNLMDDRLGGTVESGGNIRFYGANPNNYVDIGDRDSSGNPILWRIIGAFETKYATDEFPCNIDSDSDGHYDNCASEKLVKIIRKDSIGNYSYDYTASGNYHNNWSEATLNKLLNGAYYNSQTTSYYNNSSNAITVDFTGKGLSEKARSKVENVLWNLGGMSTSSLYTEEYYKNERGIAVYSGNPTEWVGKIGLIYSSDYGYATDLGSCSQKLYDSTSSYTCKTDDWLYNSTYQWIITSDLNTSYYAFYIDLSGYISYGNVNYTSGVRPTLYLKSDVCIVGTETTSDGVSYYVVE